MKTNFALRNFLCQSEHNYKAGITLCSASRWQILKSSHTVSFDKAGEFGDFNPRENLAPYGHKHKLECLEVMTFVFLFSLFSLFLPLPFLFFFHIYFWPRYPNFQPIPRIIASTQSSLCSDLQTSGESRLLWNSMWEWLPNSGSMLLFASNK